MRITRAHDGGTCVGCGTPVQPREMAGPLEDGPHPDGILCYECCKAVSIAVWISVLEESAANPSPADRAAAARNIALEDKALKEADARRKPTIHPGYLTPVQDTDSEPRKTHGS